MNVIEFIKENQGGVLLNDYTLKDMEWFMTEFAKHYHTEQLNLCGVGVTLVCASCGVKPKVDKNIICTECLPDFIDGTN